MNEVVMLAVVPYAAKILAAEDGSLIPSLLTGGGFVFLAAIMTGLFMWNKNRADGAAALAKGSTELTEGVRKEINEIKQDRDEVKKQCKSCQDELAATVRRFDDQERRISLQDRQIASQGEQIANLQAGLRATIVAIDSNDPRAVENAITKARDLI